MEPGSSTGGFEGVGGSGVAGGLRNAALVGEAASGETGEEMDAMDATGLRVGGAGGEEVGGAVVGGPMLATCLREGASGLGDADFGLAVVAEAAVFGPGAMTPAPATDTGEEDADWAGRTRPLSSLTLLVARVSCDEVFIAAGW